MKKKYLVELTSIIKDSLSAHKMADWSNKKVIETVSTIVVKKFARYMKEQK